MVTYESATLATQTDSSASSSLSSEKTRKKVMLFDEAISQTCGFGRYQYLLFISMALINSYGMVLMYAFGYLTNPLDYEVLKDGIWMPMEREQICSQKVIDYRPIINSSKHINAFYS